VFPQLFVSEVCESEPYPAAAAAVPADGADQPVDHLEGAQADLDQAGYQQDAEQGQVPRDDVPRARAHIPQCVVGQVVSEGHAQCYITATGLLSDLIVTGK